jgi:6-phosphogluconolactonase/glucosamine-6-phosphate isomerase/deaminase
MTQGPKLSFIKIGSPEPVAKYLADVIGEKLDGGKKVLWLVAGGSSINIAVHVAKLLSAKNLAGLTVSLTDERYGPAGHKDSNWQQLKDAGFNLPGATMQPVLSGGTIQATSELFAKQLSKDLDACDYSIGLFGIGLDGHTAGILPDSSAGSSSDLATYYDGEVYQRVTITPRTIGMLDEIVVFAFGKEKWPVLDKLDSEVSASVMPAQLLKQSGKLTVFNDRKGEKT